MHQPCLSLTGFPGNLWTIKDVAPYVVLISFNQNSRIVGYGFENQRIPFHPAEHIHRTVRPRGITSAHRPGTEKNAGGRLDLNSGR